MLTFIRVFIYKEEKKFKKENRTSQKKKHGRH